MVPLSDHYMVYCIRKFNGAVEKDHKKIKLAYDSRNQFLFDISGMCWDQFFQPIDDKDILANKWPSLFSFIIKKHAPLKQICISER